jgi:hypothetical protein
MADEAMEFSRENKMRNGVMNKGKYTALDFFRRIEKPSPTCISAPASVISAHIQCHSIAVH